MAVAWQMQTARDIARDTGEHLAQIIGGQYLRRDAMTFTDLPIDGLGRAGVVILPHVYLAGRPNQVMIQRIAE